MLLRKFDYHLPDKLIAQEASKPRHNSKLICFNSKSQQIDECYFYDLYKYLGKNDVLVINNSKVMPSKLKFSVDGKELEIVFLKQIDDYSWEVLGKPAKKMKAGTELKFNNLRIKFVSRDKEVKTVKVNLSYSALMSFLNQYGLMPLPPYIHNDNDAKSRYQTIYSKLLGSAAAPTAGLHFTKELLNKLKSKGVEVVEVTLHVGLGTFLPVRSNDVKHHKMHREYYQISATSAHRLNQAIMSRKRIIAVGTTSVRVLESAYKQDFGFSASKGDTDIFITPGYEWKVVKALITNFHLPKSTLIMLVSALIGLEHTKKLYEFAVSRCYRFYSYGDAMFLF